MCAGRNRQRKAGAKTGGKRSRLHVVHERGAVRAALADYPPLLVCLDPVWRHADHLAILTDRVSGQATAMLAARFATTGRDPFLWLDSRIIRPRQPAPAIPQGTGVMAELAEPCEPAERGVASAVPRADARAARRMVSALLLRLATMEDLPAALVIRADQPALVRALRDIAATIAKTTLYPAPETAVIPLRSAARAIALQARARRVAR
jgi:hypothetical protein